MAILSEKEEQRLWESAIFAFDSSALLNLYRITKEKRSEIYKQIFEDKLYSRLWISGQVHSEYLKNRESVLRKLIKEQYSPVEEDCDKIQKCIKSLQDIITGLENRTKMSNQHPSVSQNKLKDILDLIGEISKDAKSYKAVVRTKITSVQKDINEMILDDDLENALETYFAIGVGFSFMQKMELIKYEGYFRFENGISPGYKDSYKQSVDKYGDFFMWKQTLDYAQGLVIKKPIILIIDDVKDDWCVYDSKHKRIESPNEDLQAEFKDIVGHEFWMYDLNSFFYKSDKYLNTQINVLLKEELSAMSSFSTFKSIIPSLSYDNFLSLQIQNPEIIIDYVPEGCSVVDLDLRNCTFSITGRKNGVVPATHSVATHFFCGYCKGYGPWSGAQCTNCGHFSNGID